MKTHYLFVADAEEFEEVGRDDYFRALGAGGFGVTVHDGFNVRTSFEVAGPAVTLEHLRALYVFADDLADPADG